MVYTELQRGDRNQLHMVSPLPTFNDLLYAIDYTIHFTGCTGNLRRRKWCTKPIDITHGFISTSTKRTCAVWNGHIFTYQNTFSDVITRLKRFVMWLHVL